LKWKEEGNELLKKKDYDKAMDKYEHSAGLFYYCYNTNPEWKKKGIDDDTIRVTLFEGTAEEEKKATELRIACYLNIALCKLKKKEYIEAVRACDEVLLIDGKNVKALYRRALGRMENPSAGGYEQDESIKDLTLASQLSPDDQTVRAFLKRLKEDKTQQKDKDEKQYGGMFGRGNIYDKLDEMQAQKAPAGFSGKEGEEMPLEQRIAEAEMLRDLYSKQGKTEEAEKLNEDIRKARAVQKEKKKPPKPPMDFSAPTPEMIEDAKKYGLDLTDPFILAELKRVQRDRDGPKIEEVPEQEEKRPTKPTEVLWMKIFIFFFIFGTIWRMVDWGWLPVYYVAMVQSLKRGVGLAGRVDDDEEYL
jgi:tetratricopeptide (TPR) repeat protein